jgi:uncharacterized membrane protein YjfL (UPF0719 family)
MTELSTLNQTFTFLLINLAYAVLALVISIVALIAIDKYLFKRIDFIDEIKQGNLAASIFYSVILLFIGLVVATALN